MVHYETGMLVPVRAPERLASARVSCVEDTVYGRLLGKAGREWAMKLCNEEKSVALQIATIDNKAKRMGLL